jgi:cobalamin biosynthesis protein CobW
MQQLLSRGDQLDGIIVETSGLALPEPLIAAFGWPAIRARTWVHGVVTVVDGEALAEGHVVRDAEALEAQRLADPSLDHREAIEDLFNDQLKAADLVLISRADRLEPLELEAVARRLQPVLRQATPCVPVAHGVVDPQLLLGSGIAAEDAIGHDHEHHDHEHEHEHEHEHHDHAHVAIESLAFDLAGGWQQAELEASLHALLSHGSVLRLKGWAALPGKQRLLQIQAVGPRLNCWFEGEPTEPAGPQGRARLKLVLLGFGLDREAITALLMASSAAD